MSAHKFICMYKGHPNKTTQTTPLIVLSLNGWVWFSWWKGICELFSRCCHKFVLWITSWNKSFCEGKTSKQKQHSAIPTEILTACWQIRGSHIYVYFCLDSARSSRLHAANLYNTFCSCLIGSHCLTVHPGFVFVIWPLKRIEIELSPLTLRFVKVFGNGFVSIWFLSLKVTGHR